jgi:hypothetical protein
LSRLLVGALLIGIICYFFYALGKKRALENGQKTRGRGRRRKFVESTVLDRKDGYKNEGSEKD